jgi:hypothetical protein
MQHVSLDKDSADFITSKLEVYGSASHHKSHNNDSNFPILNPLHRGCMFEHYMPATPTHSPVFLSHALNQTVLRISLAFAILLNAYALPISRFLISNRMQENQALKRISRSGRVK